MTKRAEIIYNVELLLLLMFYLSASVLKASSYV